jgi:hypothetical protein
MVGCSLYVQLLYSLELWQTRKSSVNKTYKQETKGISRQTEARQIDLDRCLWTTSPPLARRTCDRSCSASSFGRKVSQAVGDFKAFSQRISWSGERKRCPRERPLL